jgi:diguanylate cyclase (GGDEF)-like protein/PAS domain S-box-containing protein
MLILIVNVVYLSVLIPHFRNKLEITVVSQGNTFANTTVAATSDELYANDFAFVIDYIMKVINQSPGIIFAKLSLNSGPNVIISGDKWEMLDRADAALPLDEGLSSYTLERKTNSFVNKNVFAYSKNFEISGMDWGVITIGVSDEGYQQLMNSLLRNFLFFNAILIAASIIVLFITSRKIRRQLFNLRNAAKDLAEGNFSSQAPPGDILELDQLAQSFNTMATSLEQQTARINQLARVVEDTSDAVFIMDKELRIIFANEAFKDIIRLAASSVTELGFADVADLLRLDAVVTRQLINKMEHRSELPWACDIKLENSKSKTAYVNLRVDDFRIEKGVPNCFFIVMSDITERKKLEHELNTLAFYDKLTDLPNRRLFHDRLQQMILRAQRRDTPFTLMFMDLDNFKIVNDSLGHDYGDILLQLVADRFKILLRKDDTVCRLGGDEFTFILGDLSDTDKISNIVEKILKALREPFDVKGKTLHIDSSIGIVTYPVDADNINDLIKKADTVMYEVKRSGKGGYRFFTEDMNQQMQHCMEIEMLLRTAITEEQMELFFQPQLETTDSSIWGFEALLRWENKVHGHIPTPEFLPIAERSGLILQLGEWVIERACSELEKWQRLGYQQSISVNISGQQLHNPNFIDRALEIVGRYDIPPNRLVFEFTETVLIDKQEDNIQKMLRLKERGVRLSIDDFGMGFSSLSYLDNFPIDVIKLDKSFIQKISDNTKSVAILSAIISLADSLELETIAEGVETNEQREWLLSNGCTRMQGFLFERPLPSEKAVALVKLDVEQRLLRSCQTGAA